MQRLLSIALVVSWLGFNARADVQVNNNPVCIIGAGPAGLSAAHALESQGHQVVIFEKLPEVGGKSQAYYENGVFHPLGALLFTNVTYANTLEIISKTNVTSESFAGKSGWHYNWTSGDVALAPEASPAFQTLLTSEVSRYIAWRDANFAPSASMGYKAGIPEALTVPTSQWLSQNNYTALPVVFNRGMATYGYGDLRQTPILYMLQYFTTDIVRFAVGIDPANLIDFHEVLVQYASNVIQGPIHTNTTVSSVDRSGPLPILTYSDNAASTPANQTCSSLIMAFAPTLSALNATGISLSANESEVFTSVQVTNYFAGAVRLSEIPRGLPFQAAGPSPVVPTDAVGEPITFISLHETSNIATTYSWGGLDDAYTYQQAYELLKEVLSRLNKDPQNPEATGVEVTDADVKGFSQTDYFPRFDSEKLAGGWYEKFNDLQGQQNTYWASGLNGFETVEFAVRAGLDVVNSYFSTVEFQGQTLS